MVTDTTSLAWRLAAIGAAVAGVIFWAQAIPLHEIGIEGGLRGVVPVSDVRTLVRMVGIGVTVATLLILWAAHVRPWMSGVIAFLCGVGAVIYVATH